MKNIYFQKMISNPTKDKIAQPKTMVFYFFSQILQLFHLKVMEN